MAASTARIASVAAIIGALLAVSAGGWAFVAHRSEPKPCSINVAFDLVGYPTLEEAVDNSDATFSVVAGPQDPEMLYDDDLPSQRRSATVTHVFKGDPQLVGTTINVKEYGPQLCGPDIDPYRLVEGREYILIARTSNDDWSYLLGGQGVFELSDDGMVSTVPDGQAVFPEAFGTTGKLPLAVSQFPQQ